MACFYCGKRVSLVRQLTDADFCSDEHRRKYHEVTRAGLDRLLDAQERMGASKKRPQKSGAVAVEEPSSPPSPPPQPRLVRDPAARSTPHRAERKPAAAPPPPIPFPSPAAAVAEPPRKLLPIPPPEDFRRSGPRLGARIGPTTSAEALELDGRILQPLAPEPLAPGAFGAIAAPAFLRARPGQPQIGRRDLTEAAAPWREAKPERRGIAAPCAVQGVAPTAFYALTLAAKPRRKKVRSFQFPLRFGHPPLAAPRREAGRKPLAVAPAGWAALAGPATAAATRGVAELAVHPFAGPRTILPPVPMPAGTAAGQRRVCGRVEAFPRPRIPAVPAAPPVPCAFAARPPAAPECTPMRGGTVDLRLSAAIPTLAPAPAARIRSAAVPASAPPHLAPVLPAVAVAAAGIVARLPVFPSQPVAPAAPATADSRFSTATAAAIAVRVVRLPRESSEAVRFGIASGGFEPIAVTASRCEGRPRPAAGFTATFAPRHPSRVLAPLGAELAAASFVAGGPVSPIRPGMPPPDEAVVTPRIGGIGLPRLSAARPAWSLAAMDRVGGFTPKVVAAAPIVADGATVEFPAVVRRPNPAGATAPARTPAPADLVETAAPQVVAGGSRTPFAAAAAIHWSPVITGMDLAPRKGAIGGAAFARPAVAASRIAIRPAVEPAVVARVSTRLPACVTDAGRLCLPEQAPAALDVPPARVTPHSVQPAAAAILWRPAMLPARAIARAAWGVTASSVRPEQPPGAALGLLQPQLTPAAVLGGIAVVAPRRSAMPATSRRLEDGLVEAFEAPRTPFVGRRVPSGAAAAAFAGPTLRAERVETVRARATVGYGAPAALAVAGIPSRTQPVAAGPQFPLAQTALPHPSAPVAPGALRTPVFRAIPTHIPDHLRRPREPQRSPILPHPRPPVLGRLLSGRIVAAESALAPATFTPPGRVAAARRKPRIAEALNADIAGAVALPCDGRPATAAVRGTGIAMLSQSAPAAGARSPLAGALPDGPPRPRLPQRPASPPRPGYGAYGFAAIEILDFEDYSTSRIAPVCQVPPRAATIPHSRTRVRAAARFRECNGERLAVAADAGRARPLRDSEPAGWRTRTVLPSRTIPTTETEREQFASVAEAEAGRSRVFRGAARLFR